MQLRAKWEAASAKKFKPLRPWVYFMPTLLPSCPPPPLSWLKMRFESSCSLYSQWSAECCLCSPVCRRSRRKWTSAWHWSPPSGTLCAAGALKHNIVTCSSHSTFFFSSATKNRYGNNGNYMKSLKRGTRFRVLGGSLRCPRSCFYITPLLKGEDKAPVPDNDLSCIQTLQNALHDIEACKRLESKRCTKVFFCGCFFLNSYILLSDSRKCSLLNPFLLWKCAQANKVWNVL